MKQCMDIKTHPPVTVLYSSHRTTIQQLSGLAVIVAKELMNEAIKNDAFVSGPVYWVYHGMDGKPDTVFTLEICVPVQGYFQSSRFSIKQLPAFKALAHTYQGPWDKLGDVYGQMFQQIDARKIPINEECREVYINIDLQHTANNITEVQLGVL